MIPAERIAAIRAEPVPSPAGAPEPHAAPPRAAERRLRGALAQSSALTMLSTIFFASASSIIVLS